MPTHDNAYKHIFSHPTMVEDLLRGFLHEDWVQQVDFGTLEKASGSYVSDDLRDREDDLVWRVRQRGEPLPGGLGAYRPSLRYHVLDEGRVTELAADNTVSDLIRLETGPDPAQLQRVIAALARRLQSPENTELRRALTVWINRIVLKRLIPGTELPQVNELKEIETMLAERVTTWTEKWKQEGIQEGKKSGERQLLERQLQRRFGPLSADFRARLEHATSEQLEQRADNILDATTLDEVFQGGASVTPTA